MSKIGVDSSIKAYSTWSLFHVDLAGTKQTNYRLSFYSNFSDLKNVYYLVLSYIMLKWHGDTKKWKERTNKRIMRKSTLCILQYYNLLIFEQIPSTVMAFTEFILIMLLICWVIFWRLKHEIINTKNLLAWVKPGFKLYFAYKYLENT